MEKNFGEWKTIEKIYIFDNVFFGNILIFFFFNFGKGKKKKEKHTQRTREPLDFTGCSSIQFFNSPPFPNTVRLPQVTYHLLCSACVTYGALCYTIGHQALPNQPLSREAEDFPRDDKYLKDVYLPTCLDDLKPV